ncbi:MAG TPA: tRNA (adenosine(37)-N6)-threonylcarbamoyltransferase complex dimerization subunit type 1 TsaB [Thermoanaerobaculia bacterium]|nr:tRNA (adenosine(37)-N6)-threonylcarbamoyltransferase complex dimerization subunit type 1 TsaB [Thermoanaerobaculia bacterium]
MSQRSAILALDTGSPTVSVAVARGGEVLAGRAVEIGRSSQRLLAMIDESLVEAGVERGGLDGIVALAGPGSFTGLRVGLATALGLHQALEVPAVALPTLEALALAVSEEAAGERRRVATVVDVLRGEWACQEWTVNGAPPKPRGEAERLSGEELEARWAGGEPVEVVGYGAKAALGGRFAASMEEGRVRFTEPAALAGPAALAASVRTPEWDAATLTAPLYFRPPAVTKPKKR